MRSAVSCLSSVFRSFTFESPYALTNSSLRTFPYNHSILPAQKLLLEQQEQRLTISAKTPSPMATNPNQANMAYNSQAAYEAQLAHQAAVYQAQAAYEAQVYEAQAAYEAQVYEAQAVYEACEAQVAYEAQLEAQQPMIIHTNAHWFWQCHLVRSTPPPSSPVVDPRLPKQNQASLT